MTLNHDTLLEKHFAKHGISDGFVPISPTAAEFDPKSFDEITPFRVRILKPHGSINWFRYKPPSGVDLAIKVLSNDRDHVRGANDEGLGAAQNRLLLAGTTNKELAYGSGVFLEIMFQFHKRLKETDLLIVSGYGFADKGINSRLWTWMDARPENRMVVLHADIGELRRNAKPSFSSNMNRYKEAKKFAYVDKWMCDCSLENLNREMRISFR